MTPTRKERKTATGRVLLLAFTLLLLVAGAHVAFAIRASPAQVILPPDADGAFAVRALDETDPSLVTVRIDGDLAAFATLDAPAPSPYGGVLLAGRIAIPQGLSPGDHLQELVIGTAQPRGQETVAARAEIAVPIIVRVPYPDAYLLASWDAQPDTASRGSRLTLTIENRGRVPVTPRRIFLQFSDDSVALPDLDFPVATVAPGEFLRREATYALPSNASPGMYVAALSVPYADTELTDAKQVPLGSPEISIDSVVYDVTERGAIVPIDVSGTVRWNQPIAGSIDASFDGRDAVAAHADVTDIHGAFTVRLYADTAAAGAPNTSVRVIVHVAQSRAERTTPLRTAKATVMAVAPWMPWGLGALTGIIVLVLLILLLRWRRLGRPPRPTTTPQASKDPNLDGAAPRETFISPPGGGGTDGTLASTSSRRS